MGALAVSTLALWIGQLAPGERWFSIVYRDARIGTANEKVRAVDGDRGAVQIDRCATRRFLRQGVLVTDEACLRAVVESKNGVVDWFEFETRAGNEGHRVEAEWLGDRLAVQRFAHGTVRRDDIALSSAPRLASLVDSFGGRARAEPIAKERRVIWDGEFVVDDETGAVMSVVDFRAVAKRVRVVRHEIVSEAVARAPFRLVEVMRDAAIDTNVKLPRARPVHRLRVRFHGGLSAATIPEDDRQRIVGARAGRVVEIVGTRATARETNRRDSIERTNEIQEIADRWRLRGAAVRLADLVERLAGGQGTPWERARRLSQFVYRALAQKRPSQLLGSADEALRTRAGDCTEHAALLSRLLDLAEIDARVVLGLVYSDRAFRLHQWVEARAGRRGNWRPLDPMFGDDDLDATYVKLQVFRPESAFFEGATALLDLLSSTRAELVAADFGSGWRSLSRH
ncbi:MAG: transglutaminase domain-containing protein [Deltaproteobacteria bacterium]|nr:transglutaminase domain-containing protein [Deltaproteobacteria bacterium]